MLELARVYIGIFDYARSSSYNVKLETDEKKNQNVDVCICMALINFKEEYMAENLVSLQNEPPVISSKSLRIDYEHRIILFSNIVKIDWVSR